MLVMMLLLVTTTRDLIHAQVMQTPLRLLQHVEDLELERCGLGRGTAVPGPVEKLADDLAHLPYLRRIGLARNSLQDSDALFLMGGTNNLLLG